MGRKALVIIGTDGTVDYVQPPDGVRYMLGSVSLLKFINSLAPGNRTAREVLTEVVTKGQAMMTVDLDLMWELLPARRARWSSEGGPAISLMTSRDRNPRISSGQKRQGTMADTDTTKDAIVQQIAQIERQIALIQQKAKDAGSGSLSDTSMKTDIAALKDLVGYLRQPSPYGDQSKNDTFYGLGKTASYETFKENTAIAENVLACVAETNGKIDRLVHAGKKFNHVAAKQDLHKIASQVTEIAQNVDLAQPWVKADLSALAKTAEKIDSLFPAKV